MTSTSASSHSPPALPLTALQAGMLFQARLDPQGGYDVEQLTMDLEEELDVAAFVEAWRHVGGRHPMLRTRFVEGPNHEPAQIVDETFQLPVTRESWGPLDDEARAARVAAILRHDRRAGFSLDDGPPPLRLFIATCGPRRAFCCWTFHHILLDGRSFAIVLGDVFAAYEALVRGQAPALVLPPPPRPFSDFVTWSRGLPTAASRPFWRALLAGKDASTPLPSLRAAAPGATHDDGGPPGYGERDRVVQAHTTTALRGLAKKSGTTLGTVVQAAWALCLNRLTGDDDVVFGTTRACRKSALDGEGGDQLVGLFINTLPVRARIDDDELLVDLLKRLRQQSLDVRAHEHTPLVDVLGQASVPRGTPLFQTLLMFENKELNASLRALSPAFQRRHFHYEEQPTFPLNVTVFDHGDASGTDTLELRVLFDRARFADVGIDNVMRWLEAVLASMTTAHTTGEVRVLDEQEAAAVLFGAHNQTTRAFPHDTLIHELFEARAGDPAFADATAVVCAGPDGADVSLTFGELERRANQLAHALVDKGAARGGYVGILLERRVELVVALFAVAKTGAAYVPLDPDYPKDRLSFMLADTAAPVVVTQAKYRELLPASAVTIDVEADAKTVATQSTARPARTATPRDVCYTIYTSGSTGKPKGVVLTHEAVVNTLDWVNREFGFSSRDRLLFVTSVCFDLSVFDVFGALGAGASIRVATSAELRDPEALVARLTSGEITVWDSAPAALHRLVPFFPTAAEGTDAGRRQRATLRLVMLSGDWIPVSLPGDLRRAFHSGLQVRSLGGATEAAIWSNFFVVDDVPAHWRSIPYGLPIQNSHYHVLDRRLRPVPPGIAGDLYIGGTCLASGYLARPELTADRFIKDPFAARASARGVVRPGHGTLYKTGDLARYYDEDGPALARGSLAGQLEFLGRADFQVKIRGFRVELGEVDAVVQRHDEIKDALSVARQDASLQKVLVTYVVPRPQARPDDTALSEAVKAHARATLPDFMVPTHVVVLRQGLPVSVNGKVDRAALPDPLTATATKEVRAPQTESERQLLPIWQAVLSTDALSVDDNFFDRGGHSLLATMLMSRIKAQLGVQVPLSRLFQANTIAKLAASIDQQRAATASSPSATTTDPATVTAATTEASSLIVLNEQGTQTPVFFIAGIGGHVFTFQKLAALLGDDVPTYGFRAIGGESGEIPKERVEDIAEAYLAELDARGLTDRPIVLCGYSFGGYVAFELALRLEARGVPPELLVFFDVLAPGYPRRLPVYERALLHVDEFRRRDVSGKAAYLRQRATNVRGRVLMKLGMAERLAGDADVGAGEFDADRQHEMRVLWGALATAQLAYRPSRTTHIPGLLFKAAIPFDWPATKFDDPTHGWRHWLKGSLTVERAEGAHLQLFEGENATTMARAIRSARR